ncbi:MAG: phosphoenolpyruvate carboxylase [Chitinophagales bacterium]|nr:phosphoenolpyruvate carboxylase [Chitinophagales bacterium]
MRSAFDEHVSIKYSLYNSLFLNLPFSGITDTGNLLPILHKVCEYGISQSMQPADILKLFFEKHGSDLKSKDQLDLLFRFVQFIERQVVLFDAIEDSSFEDIHNLKGKGTVHELLKFKNQAADRENLLKLLNSYMVRIVLTAHPTQFYPGNVLSIITDLEVAIRKNDLHDIQELLQQLGRTRFYKRQKPTPEDEAISLIWYLENVFYEAIGKLLSRLDDEFSDQFTNAHLFEMGFWPGGDRDGNPFVDDATTLTTARLLKVAVLNCYIRHILILKRRITFPKADDLVRTIEENLQLAVDEKGGYQKASEFLSDISSLKKILIEENSSLYLDKVKDLERRVKNFGFYFATIDLRQDSRVHHDVVCDIVDAFGENKEEYGKASFENKLALLQKLETQNVDINFLDEISSRTIKSIEAMINIQESNGEYGCNRYIISNTQSADNLIELQFMIRLVFKNRDTTVDLVPLFETIDDLEAAPAIMQKLYSCDHYRKQLEERGSKQTIMLGFSDGTKDGGYLTANWAILTAKEGLSKVAKDNGVELVFFDGRGGPPARGGGKTHAFYASLPETIQNNGIHLTIQGQTISSNFGTIDAAKYNLEQLLTAGLSNFTDGIKEEAWDEENRQILSKLSEVSYDAYMALRKDENFLDYLAEITVLRFYGQTNIGSRPSKRSADSGLSLENLRAIPYVGSWSQMKQNVPGYYGVGLAIQKLIEEGEKERLERLYNENEFFKALMANSMQSLAKTNFTLTNYLEHHPRFGDFWKRIQAEYERSVSNLLEITGMESLMSDTPDGKSSILFRQLIIQPLLVIQQTAMMKLQNPDLTEKEKEIWQKLVIRCFFGNINATRNAA